MAILAALDAMRSAGLKAKSNIKFAFEGEEEGGSPNLAKILRPTRSCSRLMYGWRAMAPCMKPGVNHSSLATVASAL